MILCPKIAQNWPNFELRAKANESQALASPAVRGGYKGQYKTKEILAIPGNQKISGLKIWSFRDKSLKMIENQQMTEICARNNKTGLKEY